MNSTHFLKVVLSISIFSFSPPSFAEQVRQGDPILPAVACRYEMTVTPAAKPRASAKSAWYFWRKPGMVQTLDADGDYGEIWQQTVMGNIQYRKLYPNDKTAVEYMPADNQTHNLNFDWVKIASMLNPSELGALKAVKRIKVLGKKAELRKGIVKDQRIEVQWLLGENLPASIIRQDKHRKIALRLVEIAPLATAKRQPIAIEAIANYRHIDAVDFGDMENDPFVKKVLAKEGHHHHL